MSPEVEQAVGLAREFLHRSGALRVGLLVDRGDEREPAVVECARLAPISVIEDGEHTELEHGVQLTVELPALPEVRQIPGIEADAAADFETLDPETPLGLAARGDEPLVALVGDEQFELAL
jgi:hypothetical protein